MELWDIYDSQKNRTGKKIYRHESANLGPGEYHLVVCMLIINKDKQILIQKRALHKKGFPGLWADTGGAALFGESSQEAIIREVDEEIGITLKEEELVHLVTQKDLNFFRDVYVAHREVDLESCILDQNEVAQVCWTTLEEIKRMIDNNQYMYFADGYLGVLAEYIEKL